MIANKTRSLVKAISWRILASADTFLISYIITENYHGLEV